MNLSLKVNRARALAGTAAVLAVAAMGFAGAAQARDNVSFSIGIGVPGVTVGVSNAYPVYNQPVYVQPAPVYYQPRPVYVQPAPVYYQPRPVYVQPAPVYYGHPHGWKKHHGKRGHDGYHVQGPRPVYGHGHGHNRGPGYGQVYYGR